MSWPVSSSGRGGGALPEGAGRGGGALPEGAGPGCLSLRERTMAENSLVLLLQGLHGQVATVDLRDESSARGRVLNVDAFMNVRLAEVLYRDRQGALTQLADLFIAGRNVRYVHLPDQLDVTGTIQGQLDRIHRVRNFAGGKKEYAKKKN